MNPIIAFAQQQNLYRILCVTYRTLPFVLIDFIDLRQEPTYYYPTYLRRRRA